MNLIATSCRARLFVASACLFVNAASAQSFNVDFSDNGVALPPSYGAAGMPGVWNTVAPPFLGSVPLVDTLGNAGPVVLLHQGASSSITNYVNPAFTGHEATLLLDGWNVGDVPGIMRFNGLQPGVYEVVVYGILPPQPTWKTKFLQLGSNPSVGGAYSGSLQLGVTHAIEQAVVASDGQLRIDWVHGGGSLAGFFSGVQVRKLCETNPVATCSASATSIPGCQGSMSGTGVASVNAPSGFTIHSGSIIGSANGLAYFGVSGPAAISLGTQGGFICANPPLYRSAIKSSGGTSGQCDGQLNFTLAELLASHPGVVSAGSTVHAGMWFRDPPNPDTFALTNGLTFDVCP